MALITLEELKSLESQVERAYNIIVEELNKRSIKFNLAEAFIYPDLKTVGIKGDARTYSYPLVISIHMPNGRLFLDYNFLNEISTKITSESKDITRVIYRLK